VVQEKACADDTEKRTPFAAPCDLETARSGKVRMVEEEEYCVDTVRKMQRR
jgi:hypothetical protein